MRMKITGVWLVQVHTPVKDTIDTGTDNEVSKEFVQH